MNIPIFIFIPSIILILLFIFIIWNLYNKVSKYESVLKLYTSYILEFSKAIKFTDERLREIDQRGSFEADDEVGFFFEQVKHLQEVLNNFKEENLWKD